MILEGIEMPDFVGENVECNFEYNFRPGRGLLGKMQL